MGKQKDSINQLRQVQQSLAQSNREISGKLGSVVAKRDELIRSRKQEELKRINKEIYMYEDHDSLYRKMDALRGDTTSQTLREKKLIELRKARNTIKF
jgi:hypothetical protein